MKHGASQLFAIVLLKALLAGLSFWLQQAVAYGETKRDGSCATIPGRWPRIS